MLHSLTESTCMKWDLLCNAVAILMHIKLQNSSLQSCENSRIENDKIKQQDKRDKDKHETPQDFIAISPKTDGHKCRRCDLFHFHVHTGNMIFGMSTLLVLFSHWGRRSLELKENWEQSKEVEKRQGKLRNVKQNRVNSREIEKAQEKLRKFKRNWEKSSEIRKNIKVVVIVQF